MITNVYASLPDSIDKEIVDPLLATGPIRIERIVSKGHTSPAAGWYDQDEHEWVVVLEGAGTLLLKDGTEMRLGKGDHVNIPAHTKHKVIWTDPDRPTIWLAVFYSSPNAGGGRGNGGG